MVVALVLTGSHTPAAGETKKAVDKGPQHGGIITLYVPTWDVIDPYRFHWGSLRASSFVYEKLAIGDWAVDRDKYDFTQSWGPTPTKYLKGQLAESWNLPDPKTLILKIRQGVHWHDKVPTLGRAFTVDDLIYNIDGWWRKSPFIDRQFTDLIEEVLKVDNRTVKLKLKKPVIGESLAGILDNDSHFFVAPESRKTKSGEIEDWKLVSGTGPWIMTDLVPGSRVQFKRNDNYWAFDEKNQKNRLPYADEAKILIIPELTTALSAFRTGKIDIFFEVQVADGDTLLETNPELNSTLIPTNGYALRMRWDLPPFNDLKMRKAVSMAIDRQAIADSTYRGKALYYGGLLKPFHADVYTPFKDLPKDIQEIMTYNPEKAKQLVADAGYPRGIKVDFNIGPDAPMSEIASIIQQYLKAVGINVEIKRNEWPEFNAIRYGKQHKHLILHWNSFYANPMQLFEWFADPTHKFGLSAVDDSVFTAKYEKATLEFDDEKRNEMTRELDHYSLRDVFFATLPLPQNMLMWHPWVGGYQGERDPGQYHMGALAARLWIIKDLKK